MHCFICERPIQADEHAVVGATIWRTSGNYGSQMYDSLIEGTSLEIAICDDCLAARKKHVDEVVATHVVKEVSRRKADLG